MTICASHQTSDRPIRFVAYDEIRPNILWNGNCERRLANVSAKSPTLSDTVGLGPAKDKTEQQCRLRSRQNVRPTGAMDRWRCLKEDAETGSNHWVVPARNTKKQYRQTSTFYFPHCINSVLSVMLSGVARTCSRGGEHGRVTHGFRSEVSGESHPQVKAIWR